MQSGVRHTGRMSFGERLKQARLRKYPQQKQAAEALGVPIGTYANHELSGRTPRNDTVEKYARAFGVSASWLSYGDAPQAEHTVVPLAGFISAGGSIDTSTEQVDPGVEYEAELYVNVPDAVQAYQVIGESMLPVFEPDTVIVCRAYSKDFDNHLGRRVAIGTEGGERFIKVLHEGTQPNRYNLESLNAGFSVIRNVELAWVARIAAIIPADEWQRLEKTGRQGEALGRRRR
jgi:phage repressor protein C with HTH and peptisase S24 domain